MIHQVTQLQMQSSDDVNSEYIISSHKMIHFVPIHNQYNSFDSDCSRGSAGIGSHFYGDQKYTHAYILNPPNGFMHCWTNSKGMK